LKRLPNILTISRIVLSPVFLFLFLSENEIMRGLSIVVFTFAALTDFFDGYLARKWEADSEFGNFVDPLADKILTFTGFFAFSYLRPDIFPYWIFFIIIGRDILITGMRMLFKRQGKSLKTSYSAKLKTAVQLVFIYISLVSFLAIAIPVLSEFATTYLFNSGVLYWMYIFVMIFTVYTAIEYIIRNNTSYSRE